MSLHLKVREEVRDDQIFHVSDGTIFYYDGSTLHTKWKNGFVNASVFQMFGCEKMDGLSAHGDALYFASKKKIIKARFNPPDISFSFVRRLRDDETVHPGGIVKGSAQGKHKYVHHLWDQPFEDFPASAYKGQLLGVIENRIFRRKDSFARGGEVIITRKGDSNVYEVEVPEHRLKNYHSCFFAQEKLSSFVYITNGERLLVLSIETLEPVASLIFEAGALPDHCECIKINRPENLRIHSIVGVHSGCITVIAEIREKMHLCTAKLPAELAENVKPSHGLYGTLPYMEWRMIEWANRDLEQREKHDEHATRRWRWHSLHTENNPKWTDFFYRIERESKYCLKREIVKLVDEMDQRKSADLHILKSLKFTQKEKLARRFECVQVEDGTIFYLGEMDENWKRTLMAVSGDTRLEVDLMTMGYDSNWKIHGTMGNHVYLKRRYDNKFITASVVEGEIRIEKINTIDSSHFRNDSSLFHMEDQPFYCKEKSGRLELFRLHENYLEVEGEVFDITGAWAHNSWARRFYYRGTMYFFHNDMTGITKRLNGKVVIVQGPIVEFRIILYAKSYNLFALVPEHSVVLVLNTVTLDVTQFSYHVPFPYPLSIVGYHNNTLTVCFDDGEGGCCLMEAERKYWHSLALTTF